MILQLPPGSPPLIQAAAAALLALHIGGGTLGIIAGGAALFLRKGLRPHAVAGKVFLFSMLVMAILGAAVSPFLPQRANVVMALFVVYLVITGWMTVKRQEARPDRGAMMVGVAAALIGLLFGFQALAAPGGHLDGDPPGSYWVLASLPILALMADVNVLRRGGVTGARRVARHLWRMGVALLIATASLFLGQPKVFPAALRGTPVLFIPVVAVLAAVIFWSVRVHLTGRKSLSAMPRPEPVRT